jgi:copper chaperone NosL
MDEHVSRRKTLQAAGLGLAVGLAGCLGDGEDVPDPVDLSGGKFDYQGGMEIGSHGGPNGQIFYADNEPDTPHSPDTSAEARDDLAWFHTLAQGLFPYHFERTNRGWEADVVYVTDYSSVEWELQETAEGPQMPAPTAPETFADAETLTYVVESDVIGGMGPDLLPFSESEDVDAFVDEHGGQTVTFDDITRQLVEGL